MATPIFLRNLTIYFFKIVYVRMGQKTPINDRFFLASMTLKRYLLRILKIIILITVLSTNSAGVSVFFMQKLTVFLFFEIFKYFFLQSFIVLALQSRKILKILRALGILCKISTQPYL